VTLHTGRYWRGYTTANEISIHFLLQLPNARELLVAIPKKLAHGVRWGIRGVGQWVQQ
jgi:hypothetical protein